LSTGLAVHAVPYLLALWQAALRVDPPVKPEGYGEVGNTHTKPSAHGFAVAGIGKSRTRPALTRRR
jgi:hypothetical protein